MIALRCRTRRPEIGIAPLIDCVFLLLLFFLLTSTATTQRRIGLQLPGSDTAAIHRERAIEVGISADGTIELHGVTVTPAALPDAFRAATTVTGPKPVLLLADRRTPLETVTLVIDAARAAELTAIAIATRDPSDSAHAAVQ